MTREKAKALLPVIKAIINGKEIQVNLNGKWVDVDDNHNCVFLPESYEYRVKPTVTYRPFKSQEECLEEMHKHSDFGWIKGKATGEYKQIVRIFDYCKTELCFNIANSNDDYTSEMMLNSYTFTDGTPFGVKEE